MPDPRLLAIYAHRPRPAGGVAEFRLSETHLGLSQGAIRAELPLADITGVRLLYKPRNSSDDAYQAKLARRNGRTLVITNLSWKSLISVEREDADYRRFVAALVPAVATANPQVRLEAGLPAWLFWVTAAAGFGAMAALALMAGRAVADRSLPIALLIACFGLYFGWWTLRYLGRNRPRSFKPDAIPTDVLPRGEPPAA